MLDWLYAGECVMGYCRARSRYMHYRDPPLFARSAKLPNLGAHPPGLGGFIGPAHHEGPGIGQCTGEVFRKGAAAHVDLVQIDPQAMRSPGRPIALEKSLDAADQGTVGAAVTQERVESRL